MFRNTKEPSSGGDHLCLRFRKATVSFVMFVCPSIRLSAWNNSAPTKWIFIQYDI